MNQPDRATATALAKAALLALGATMLAAPAAAAAEPAPAPNWATALRQDATAFHDLIAANHPGPVNRLDPGFTRRNDLALAEALARAAKVTDYPGYLNGMRGYAARFDDGHLSFQPSKEVPVDVRWPGFLTAYDDHGAQVVRARADDAPVPLGAMLVGCDGRPAAALAKTNIGDFRGRWSLPAIRGRLGWRLFIDAGNPFIVRPRVCNFTVAGKPRSVTLAWRDMPDRDYNRYTAPLSSPPLEPIGTRRLDDGTRWFTMSDFDGDPGGATARALLPLIATMRQSRGALVAAPRIVLDLRGNGGGSSDWSRQIADIIWGSDAVEKAAKDPSWVEWRASQANVARLAQYKAEFDKSPNASGLVRNYFTAASKGIAAANAAGKPLWREPDNLYQEVKLPGGVPYQPLLGVPVYVLTDWSCGSACLDAVDLWKALGAVQIGQETGADTLYMDIRSDELPSGYGRAGIPMKVYRNRPRGSNVSQKPARAFAGDMRDTAALEKWVMSLPGR